MSSVVGGSGVMFDRIAQRYDRLNRIMSFGMDRSWRTKLVRAMKIPVNARVLDVATGTADVAIAVADTHQDSHVVGLDPSANMLAVGQTKIASYGERIRLVQGDAQALPFANAAFDACCISFGIRNVPDRAKGLAEMIRVVKPGGRVVVLELGEPTGGGPMACFARLHVHHVVPRLGAFLSKAPEYRYLQKSIAAFPPADAFAQMMRTAGLQEITVKRLAFGAAHIYSGTV
ncbi:MAG: bifunctional demethylmenaquinone methyltransferase/2-methoxy-6-polyprenyl-1,4-benzoquinol methylase UbiE [Clostridia bacterium]|nr:bifunctional demethylmenaquinone methyltransferase/2-methoxy-6-polyprenyl-1,4-benzoquinol methylase UbiE [Deltaproteobacteria bacterium]